MSSRPVIVLDPGHGGARAVGGSSPNNAVGPNGLLERDLTLDLARRVRRRLDGDGDVVLTRDADVNLSLVDRAAAARQRAARVFVSLHFNGTSDERVDGTEAWIGRSASAASRDLGQSLIDQVAHFAGIRNRGVRARDLGVVQSSRHAPGTAACLLEVAFLSNRAQASRLGGDAYRDGLADAIATGVLSLVAGRSLPAPDLSRAHEETASAAFGAPLVDYYACLLDVHGIRQCPRVPPVCIRPRAAGALAGSQAIRQSAIWNEQEPAGAAWEAREEAIYRELKGGNVPDFVRRFVPVTIKGTGGDGQPHEITYRVMPDYLAMGSDADYVTIPLGARTAERVADTFGCVLPTAKMVWDIYSQTGTVRLSVRPRGYAGSPDPKERAKQTSTWAYAEYSQALQKEVDAALAAAGKTRGALVAGYKKEVVVSAELPAKRQLLVFYGGWLRHATKDGRQKEILQGEAGGLSHAGPHHAQYADYSHGVRLVSRAATADGRDRDIAEVLADPALAPLLVRGGTLDLTRARYQS